MTAEREVLVPDIGDFKDVDVIEILVKPGDAIQVETPLITIESDKAVIEVPSPYAGIVKDIRVKVGEKVASVVRVPAPFVGGMISSCLIIVAPMCRVAPISLPSTSIAPISPMPMCATPCGKRSECLV
jgi:pyruvate dehydrogenase E2 component (dihydrolipoamide acetyltransferase)